MTSKEKAEELVESFMSIKKQKLSDFSMIYYPTAKQCAIIAVNEMIDQLPFTDINTGIGRWCEMRRQYLNEVKQEIEQL